MEAHANVLITHIIGFYQLHLSFLNQTLDLHLTQHEQTLIGRDGNRIWIECNLLQCSGYFSFDGKQYYSLKNNGKNHFVSTINIKNSFINTLRKKRSVLKFKQPLYVEYTAIVDKRLIFDYNDNMTLIKIDILDIVSKANKLLYNPFKISLLLVDIIFWKSDKMEFKGTIEQLVVNFQEWVKNSNLSKSHDLIHLYTGSEFGFVENPPGGAAVKGSICKNDHSSGVIAHQLFRSKSRTAEAVAHEVGHAFNLEHDSYFEECANKYCIMTSTSINFLSTTCWTSCSEKSMHDFLSRGGGMCLHNRPSEMIGQSVCGNNIVEQDEECDCGPLCDDKCCDNKTCLFTENSLCSANDLCCDLSTCKYNEKGTVCRNSNSECDLAELCSGKTAECPKNTFKQNGVSCNNNNSMCYNGKCVILEYQCEFLNTTWKESQKNCYKNNAFGNETGNCGLENGKYIACTSDNIACGSLLCEENQNNACKSSFFYGNISLLVDDGTKCAHEKYCISQKCIPTKLKSCANNCSANGYCNNLLTCQCNEGWSGNDCSIRDV